MPCTQTRRLGVALTRQDKTRQEIKLQGKGRRDRFNYASFCLDCLSRRYRGRDEDKDARAQARSRDQLPSRWNSPAHRLIMPAVFMPAPLLSTTSTSTNEHGSILNDDRTRLDAFIAIL